MRFKFKRVLRGVIIAVLLFIFLMTLPRILAFINPDAPPVGYHFRTLDLLAAGIGLEKLVDRNPRVPPDIVELKDIEYKNVNGISLQLDIYRSVNQNEPAPLLVFIHGGGWRSGKRSDYLVYLIPFAQQGFITATVSYRLVKDALYPACVEDVIDAVEWLYRNGSAYGCDTGRIALIGGSAGAHLAMLAGYGWKNYRNITYPGKGSPGIKCIVDIYGPVDLTTEYARNHHLVTGFIGRPWDETPEPYREASPLTWVNSNSPPTLILHGTSDELVPVSQSVLLEQKLKQYGVPAEFCRLPLWPHTMDIVKRVNEYCKEKMTGFFRKYLQ